MKTYKCWQCGMAIQVEDECHGPEFCSPHCEEVFTIAFQKEADLKEEEETTD